MGLIKFQLKEYYESVKHFQEAIKISENIDC